MDTASYLAQLEKDGSPFITLLKTFIPKFGLAIEQLIKTVVISGIDSVEKIFSYRNKDKYATVLVSFLNEGRIKVTNNDVAKWSTETLQENLILALQFIQGKLISKRIKEKSLDGIPDEQFYEMKRSFI